MLKCSTIARRLSFAVFAIAFLACAPSGAQQNYEEALRRAEEGAATAQIQLGLLYREGREVAQDSAEAVRWFRLAAEQGAAQAQAYLGSMYFEGRGVAQDDMQALRWFRLAAEQGNILGRVGLAAMYTAGRGVSQDHSEAARWIRLAAEQDGIATHDETEAQAMALFMLGMQYVAGMGVPQDGLEGVRWLRMAAARQETDAQAMAQSTLGAIYQNGIGVEQDFLLAYMWFSVADSMGDEQAGNENEIVERNMNPEEISRATEMARACIASGYRDCGPGLAGGKPVQANESDGGPRLRHLSVWTSPAPEPDSVLGAVGMLGVRVALYCEQVALQPVFDGYATEYDAVVPDHVDINVLAAAAKPGASIEVNLTSASGKAIPVLTSERVNLQVNETKLAVPRVWSIAREVQLGAVSLPGIEVGGNLLEVRVTSDDGEASRSYIVELNRLKADAEKAVEPGCPQPAVVELRNAIAAMEFDPAQ